ncbi:CCXG family PEP-CTERM protein [Pseudoduganella danionis]|uniref:PEP-CTERM sorting domain-containing protein n=1 Tax=Pseudoduganella danionis TaxID=1890295 RepID=A0ABW9SJE5_9BURK|nr:CCXG family PEP-CTERM protein [Pseudoduganella danionis]MTW32110.1 PEP-CTERM sorting domain-containing protein [Pseudoduganella danionis]
MKNFKFAALALALAAIGSANAAVITFQTGTSTAGIQSTAQAYADVVNAAVSAPGAHSVVLSSYDNVSNNSIFHAGTNNIAFKSTINFGLTSAGTYSFRAGVDFGNGGAVFLDGQVVDIKKNDMWWGGSYSNSSQYFQVSGAALSAGNHTLTIYGLEGCCDGGQQVQFAKAGDAYQSFSANTLAPVPEPETYAMLLGGLAMLGVVARRRRA